MKKLLSVLIAAVFAASTGSVFAASHVKAAGEKTEMSKEAKKEGMKAEKKVKKVKKAKKAKKEEMKK